MIFSVYFKFNNKIIIIIITFKIRDDFAGPAFTLLKENLKLDWKGDVINNHKISIIIVYFNIYRIQKNLI